MSPTKFNGREINGPRPSPLSINRDSHLVKKSNSSVSVNLNQNQRQQQQRQPVIIYTHSPKVIHTQARDFMALVQKLTGFSRSIEQIQQKSDENEESSVVTDENSGGGQVNSGSMVNPYLCDVPLFTPNSTDYFCTPKPIYRYSDSLYGAGNMGNPISPSVFYFFKGFPES